MKNIGIGVIGAGYMGKAHSVALKAVGTVFNTNLRPVCEMICTSSEAGAALKAMQYGFNRSTANWQDVVNDPKVEAIIIASPQATHLEIALAAFKAGKPVFCEKPVGLNLSETRIMAAAANDAGIVNMSGFNYIRTPASQLARQMLAAGEIGEITYFRGEHTEDFYANPQTEASWRTTGKANGTMGDLSPHMINAMLALVGPIDQLVSDIETVHSSRPSGNGMEHVTNDDHGQFICKFKPIDGAVSAPVIKEGAMGALYFSRIATGRKMGYAYEITGTKGAIRFDQEDQNAIWLYKSDCASNRQGFTKILTGPEHPDYVEFCQGPGHGTGYQDQIIIEIKDFLNAIEAGKSTFPSFDDALEVAKIVEASWISKTESRWVHLDKI
ncbi:MAG: Gfo/Idh/MocA family protein [Alphaproteobacteria bacterium]